MFHETLYLRARTDHWCPQCEQYIIVGDRYARQSGVDDDGWWSVALHPECLDEADRLYRKREFSYDRGDRLVEFDATELSASYAQWLSAHKERATAWRQSPEAQALFARRNQRRLLLHELGHALPEPLPTGTSPEERLHCIDAKCSGSTWWVRLPILPHAREQATLLVKAQCRKGGWHLLLNLWMPPDVLVDDAPPWSLDGTWAPAGTRWTPIRTPSDDVKASFEAFAVRLEREKQTCSHPYPRSVLDQALVTVAEAVKRLNETPF